MLIHNPSRAKLEQGVPILGTWQTMGSARISEILARAGLDFVLLDFEHGTFKPEEIPEFVNACEKFETSPWVRIPLRDEWALLQALDQGAHGVFVPHVDTRDQVEEIAQRCRYFPVGTRGYSPYTKAAGFSPSLNPDYAATANRCLLVGVIIESLEGLRNLPEIASVPGIDLLYFGSYDLSQQLDVPGQTRHPKVLEAIRAGVRTVQSQGKWAGGYVTQNEADIEWAYSLGLRMITHQVDAHALLQAYTGPVECIKSLRGK